MADESKFYLINGVEALKKKKFAIKWTQEDFFFVYAIQFKSEVLLRGKK